MTILKPSHFASFFERLSQWGPIRLAYYVMAIVVTVVAATILTRALVPPAPSPWHSLVWLKNLGLPLALVFLYAHLVHLIEHRPAGEIGMRKHHATLLAGMLVGAVLMGTLFLTLLGFGWAQITGGTGLVGLPQELLTPLVTAIGEELLFRVVLFRVLEEMTGTTVAIVVSAAAFGFSHAANPGATPFTIAALSIDMGVLLALAYALTRNIWFAVGIHMSWNFTQGYVFGGYDSGLRDPHSLLRTTLSGSDWLTGGRFGPEGSILTLGLSIAASLILVALIRRKRNWQAPRLRLRLQTA